MMTSLLHVWNILRDISLQTANFVNQQLFVKKTSLISFKISFALNLKSAVEGCFPFLFILFFCPAVWSWAMFYQAVLEAVMVRKRNDHTVSPLMWGPKARVLEMKS